jgi:hypothetical protein
MQLTKILSDCSIFAIIFQTDPLPYLHAVLAISEKSRLNSCPPRYAINSNHGPPQANPRLRRLRRRPLPPHAHHPLRLIRPRQANAKPRSKVLVSMTI